MSLNRTSVAPADNTHYDRPAGHRVIHSPEVSGLSTASTASIDARSSVINAEQIGQLDSSRLVSSPSYPLRLVEWGMRKWGMRSGQHASRR